MPVECTVELVVTVQPGDTLWRIAQACFGDPLRWREIWAANPDLQNPHLIFPGQRLLLPSVSGRRMRLGDEERE